MTDNILKSASKIVFILMALASCVALFTGKITAENFMTLAAMAFAFYFSHKGDASADYLGK